MCDTFSGLGEILLNSHLVHSPPPTLSITDSALFIHAKTHRSQKNMAPTATESRLELGSSKEHHTSSQHLDRDLEMTNPTLEFIKSLTNLADIQECLRRLEMEETKVDADLDELLAEREDLEASLDKLEVLE